MQRYPIQLEWAINQGFEINHYQPLLFIVDSFDHLFSLVDQLESWMKAGKLSNVAPGEPEVNEEDLEELPPCRAFLISAEIRVIIEGCDCAYLSSAFLRP